MNTNRTMTTSAAIQNGLTILNAGDDVVLKDKLRQAMEDCGYDFSTDKPETLKESEAQLEKFVVASRNNRPVHIPVKPDSIIATLHKGAALYDYDAEYPVTPCTTTKMPQGEEAVGGRIKMPRGNKRKDAEDMTQKPTRETKKTTWTAPAPAATPAPAAAPTATTTTSNNTKENATMTNNNTATVEKTTVSTEGMSAENAALMARLQKTAEKLGMDPTKAAPTTGIVNRRPAAVGQPAKKIMTLAPNAYTVRTSNSFWYREVEGLDGINPENAVVSPIQNRDGETWMFRVEFKEPVLGVEKLEFLRTTMKGVLYIVNAKVQFAPLMKGFKVKYTKADDGSMIVLPPSFQSGVDAEQKPKYYSHIELIDKDGKFLMEGFRAVILNAAECILDFDGMADDGNNDE